jgi:hypothetical protein
MYVHAHIPLVGYNMNMTVILQTTDLAGRIGMRKNETRKGPFVFNEVKIICLDEAKRVSPLQCSSGSLRCQRGRSGEVK